MTNVQLFCYKTYITQLLCNNFSCVDKEKEKNLHGNLLHFNVYTERKH